MVEEPNQIASPRGTGSARWLVVLLLAAVAGALLVELGRTSSAVGQGLGGPVGAGRGLLVVPSPLSRDSYGVYLVDAEKGKMCLYEYQASHRQLRLVAVRNFAYDLCLDEYNTQPSPSEMRQLAEQLVPAEAPGTKQATSEPAEGIPAEHMPAEE